MSSTCPRIRVFYLYSNRLLQTHARIPYLTLPLLLPSLLPGYVGVVGITHNVTQHSPHLHSL
jgi:hypothetical protein